MYGKKHTRANRAVWTGPIAEHMEIFQCTAQMPGTTSTVLPSFSHDQHHETDAAKRKRGIYLVTEQFMWPNTEEILLHCAPASGAVYCNWSCLCVCVAGGRAVSEPLLQPARAVFASLWALFYIDNVSVLAIAALSANWVLLCVSVLEHDVCCLLYCALASGAVYCNRSCLCVCVFATGGRAVSESYYS